MTGSEEILQRRTKPFLLKIGLALAFSFAGFLYFRLRTKRGDLKLPPSPPAVSGDGSANEMHLDSQRAASGHKLQASATPRSPRFISNTAEIHDEIYHYRPASDISIDVQSPISAHSREKEGSIFPGFGEALCSRICLKIETETGRCSQDMPKSLVMSEQDLYKQEIKHLRNMVRMLQETERNLKVKLLEFYEMKEQEAIIMELKNQLKINDMEAKFLGLQIESLQVDNNWLETQVIDQNRVVADLEVKKSKIRTLKKKLRSETEQHKKQIMMLQQRIELLQEHELNSTKRDVEDQSNLFKLKQLEHDVQELGKSNMRLQIENSELDRKLESTQILANCILENPEAEVLKKQIEHLRHENESLTNEIEQLQADRCTDVEQLVYLRWLNACLRYELRNYRPLPGKTVGRDLSKTLSPKSEEKAKQLILEYADGTVEKALGMVPDIDSDKWSSSPSSFFTDIGEVDESSPATNSSTSKVHSSKKSKLFAKLRKLVHGKDKVNNSKRISSSDKLKRSISGTGSTGDSPGSSLFNSLDNQVMSPRCLGSFRRSFDTQRPINLKLDDIKDFEGKHQNRDSGTFSSIIHDKSAEDQKPNDEETDLFENNDIMKYSRVIKDSQGKTSNIYRKSASASSFL